MSYIVLPFVGAGKMPGMVGLPSFIIEHLIFGMVLGLWLILRPADVAGRAQGNAEQAA